MVFESLIKSSPAIPRTSPESAAWVAQGRLDFTLIEIMKDQKSPWLSCYQKVPLSVLVVVLLDRGLDKGCLGVYLMW